MPPFRSSEALVVNVLHACWSTVWLVMFMFTHPRDSQTRKIQENITNVEKHFGDMCQLFAAYVRKTARLRDKADLLVREISLYADTETPSLKRGMKQYADHLAKIQDYRQAEVTHRNLHSGALTSSTISCSHTPWIHSVTGPHVSLCLVGGKTWSQSHRAIKKLWSCCQTKKGKCFLASALQNEPKK